MCNSWCQKKRDELKCVRRGGTAYVELEGGLGVTVLGDGSAFSSHND